MAKQITAWEINSKGCRVAIFDKTNKNTKYNYLVEVMFDGKSTEDSKFFIEKEDAEEYFNEIKSKSDFKKVEEIMY